MAGNRNSGRKKKTKELRALHNSVDRAEHRDRVQPDYDPAIPDPPETLDETALIEWVRITELLSGKRVITQVDLANLAIYCGLFSTLQKIKAEMKKKKFRLVVKGKENPLCRMERQTAGQMRGYLGELGITPASRSKVTPLPVLLPPDVPIPTTSGPRLPAEDFNGLEKRLTQRKVVAIDDGRKLAPT